MIPRKTLPALLVFLGALTCATPSLSAGITLIPDNAPAPSNTVASFPLVANGIAASIVIPADAPEVVRIAAGDFAADVERVTGTKPEILNASPSDPAPTHASARPRVRVVFSEKLAGRWEAFQLSATAGTLTVAGSDPRALAYGLYELSRRIGVSPWYWWADVPVARRETLRLATGDEPVDQPAVKYRGIFINDEDWGLVPWAQKTFEPEVGNLGPKTYSRMFELLLRLRANTLWPGMHPTTKPFHQVPGNAAAADRYAIVVGSSHAEPMLRNNVGEWKQENHLYNYIKNREGVLAYWEQRVKERASGESIYTLGMRGIHDSAIVGPKTQRERIDTLEKIIGDQRALLARYIGNGDPARAAQMFCPYKEVLTDYEAGLRVPEDVILMWPDDNFGYVRRYATDAERKRPGGLGVYYHLSYLGAPFSWLWVDSLPPALIWSEMIRAYEQGARTLWIANVGDLKCQELSTEFFLDLAWRADRTTHETPARFLRDTAARDFGEKYAEAVADIRARHQHLATARKPEHLQWHLPRTPYQPSTLTEGEMRARLAGYAALARDVETLEASLPAAARDAFFEFVTYPATIAAAYNERYFNAELARIEKARGRDQSARDLFSISEKAYQRCVELTRRYNEEIASGKWKHIVRINGMDYKSWLPRFQPADKIPPLDSDAQAAVKAPAPAPPSTPPVTPADARPGDFFECDGVVSIHAGNFAARSDLPSGGGWRAVAGLGRTGNAVTVLPSTAAIDSAAAPRLSYRFHVATGGAANARIRLLPTFPIIPGRGLRLALALDDGAPVPVVLNDGFDTSSDEWKNRVLSNATEVSVRLPKPIKPGWHTLHLVAVDAGVVVDKIVLDFGGLRPSYDGPAETRM